MQPESNQLLGHALVTRLPTVRHRTKLHLHTLRQKGRGDPAEVFERADGRVSVKRGKAARGALRPFSTILKS
jgi:hypothetical protein